MSTLTTFLQLLDEFVNELEQTYPQQKRIKTYKMKYETLKETNPRKVLELFMTAIHPLSSNIVNKDETCIINETTDFIKDLGLKEIWELPQTTANTKDAIWSHLNTLYVFGSAINTIPDDLLKNIESIAQQCATGMQEGELGNGKDMLLGMQQLLQGQLGKKED